MKLTNLQICTTVKKLKSNGIRNGFVYPQEMSFDQTKRD